tara:strand:+ start:3604 stop:3876 length:273 start_codon:yes stop_codon:yes gene_type:complete
MITKEQFLNINKSNTITLSYSSAMRSGSKVTLKPVSKPRYSARYKLYKLTMKNIENLEGVKYYAYLREGNEKAGFAIGNMAITVKEIQIN